MKKIHLDLPQTAVVNVLQRGSDLVLILTNGEERIVRDVYEGGEPAAEAQLAFNDGAVLAVSGAGLGESLSTSEVISTKTGDVGFSDPMVGPATATAMVPSFFSTEEGQAAAAGLFGLLGLALISRDNDNDSDPDRPDAMDDVSTVDAGQTVEIDVLENDVNSQGVVGGEGLEIELLSQPSNGSAEVLTLISDPTDEAAARGEMGTTEQTVFFTADPDGSGTGEFTYRVTDLETGETDTATVTVNVTPAPPPTSVPDAVDDTSSGDLNQTQTINVLGNDVPGAGTLTIASFDQPANGTVVLSEDGQGFVYTPNANYFGSDDFEYTVTDLETGETDTATVTVEVVAPAPDAMDDTSNGAVGQSQTIDVLANDEEGVPGNGDISVSSFEQPANGAVVLNGNGQLVYTPNEGFEGNDPFDYTITEAETNLSDTATATAIVSDAPPPSPAPNAMDDTSSGAVGQTQTIDVLANDAEGVPGNNDLVVIDAFGSASGVVQVADDGKSITYTPDAGFEGEDAFSYIVREDDTGQTDIATVRVTVSPDPAPDAMDDTSSGAAGQSQTIDVLANDVEGVPGNGDISISGFEQPANGTVVSENGQLVYTPDAGFEGDDTFRYTITEAETGKTDMATVNVTVGDPGLLDFALADGGLLGEVTGNSGLLGDVTGSDGVLGDLLGTGGTLGDVGGAEGLVGDLTGLTLLGDGSGDDAILDPLVADEGALGELTGDNGLLADVSGASGLVGDLVTNGGTLGDVTGIDGLVGDLTGRDTLSEPTGEDVSAGDDGLLDGLLGGGEGDGLLDGVLGGGEGDGLLDGVLGGGEGDGLLDGVLGGGEGDGLLDGLLGGDGGLLGGLTGDTGADGTEAA